MLDDTVASEIGARYDLGQWHTVHPLSDGQPPDGYPLSDGFRISAEAGDFGVAVSAAGRSDGSLRFEAMLLSHLEDRGYLAPRLVRTRAGRPWYRSAAGGAVLVTEWVEGDVVDVSLAQHRRRGVQALAEYHVAVRSFPPRLRVEGGPSLFILEREGPAALEAFTGTAGWHLDADGRRSLRSASSFLRRQFVNVPELLRAGGATLPRLVIHGGFGAAAILLDGSRPGFPATGLAGFGRCRYDRRAVDLAGALETFARAAAGGYDLDRCAEVMATYDEVDRLPPAELAALPTILRCERLIQVFRLLSGVTNGPVHGVVKAIDEHAAHLRWLEEREVAFVEALASSCVG